MNILILSWRGPGHPNAGGAEISSHEHTKGWVKQGHKVTLFTSSFNHGKKDEIIDGIHIKRRGFEIFGVQFYAFFWYCFVNKDKFDLVVDEFHGIPFFTPFYVRVKKLAFIHEVAKEVWSLNSWPKPINLLPTILGTFFEPLIFKSIYNKIPFMTVSDSTKEDLTAWSIPKKSIYVIHNGITLPKGLKKFEKEKSPTLMFLGAISKDKGIEDAIKVFSIIYKQDIRWKFWVVGKSEKNYLIKLKLIAEKLKIGKKVIFFDFVTEGKKFELLSRAHMLINTSFREGWGLVVTEAAYVGTPTVGYNVAGLRDSIQNGKTGELCDKNPLSCAEKIINLAQNKDRYKKMQQNCINWSRKFSWKNSISESINLIENLVKKS